MGNLGGRADEEFPWFVCDLAQPEGDREGFAIMFREVSDARKVHRARLG